MSTLRRLTDRSLIRPPRWLPGNVRYETIMGSVAYGVSSETSDVDVYGFAIPPKEDLFPHLRGEIVGFVKSESEDDHGRPSGRANGPGQRTRDFERAAMRYRLPSLLMTGFLLLARSEVAQAGMPSVTLTDVARMRVQTLSFFLLGILVCSWVVQRIWNALGRDFPRLPRLSFGKALGVVTLWGLLFVLVLTMISGARELMTPGAWKKDGYTYKLAESQPSAPPNRHEADRRQALERLRIALWTYARGHGGRFPPADARDEIPEEAWRVPDPSGMRYLYLGGLVADQGQAPLAYEPGLFGAERFVLRTDGQIVPMSLEEVRRNLDAGRAP